MASIKEWYTVDDGNEVDGKKQVVTYRLFAACGFRVGSVAISISAFKYRPELSKMLEHCTTTRSYFFCIKKCGADDCFICEKPRLSKEVFNALHVLSDPEPDGHYKPFQEVYGTDTSEKYRPSLIEKSQTGHQIPFSPSAQTAKTCRMLVYCVDCEKPRVKYSTTKKLKRMSLTDF
ncbi:uncharacterized protein LOC128558303 [Mercenaria mercenaria]|uniref:uncharacterized protein LOC128558303 n=1 Tax=Mercenaria mercenaria TaxID=6596 RepID=UPI00234F35D2|nr:uncharacterized protein LOC128558303 [Mercenaria mercenaria]